MTNFIMHIPYMGVVMKLWLLTYQYPWDDVSICLVIVHIILLGNRLMKTITMLDIVRTKHLCGGRICSLLVCVLPHSFISQ